MMCLLKLWIKNVLASIFEGGIQFGLRVISTFIIYLRKFMIRKISTLLNNTSKQSDQFHRPNKAIRNL